MRSEHTIENGFGRFPHDTDARAPGAAILRGLRTLIHVVHEAQMRRFLHGLSDRHLATIGITRADIPAYARRLVRDEQP